jgi:hypothetical protein
VEGAEPVITVDARTDWAAVLNDLLAMARMSQAQLARESGFLEGQVSKWCRGVVVPDQATLLRLLPPLGWRMQLAPEETP